MTTTQRPRPARPSSQPSAPNPASRGMILVVVAVVLGVILLVKGGGIGFDQGADDLAIDPAGDESSPTETSTTLPPPVTSVPPGSLKVTVLNGAGIDGFAGQGAAFLNDDGYTATTAITAAEQTPNTVVFFAPGFDVDAYEVAAALGMTDPANIRPLPEGTALARDGAEYPADTNVAVLLGPNSESVITDGGAAAPTTAAPTTAASSTG